jgi:hypothetical protein
MRPWYGRHPMVALGMLTLWLCAAGLAVLGAMAASLVAAGTAAVGTFMWIASEVDP